MTTADLSGCGQGDQIVMEHLWYDAEGRQVDIKRAGELLEDFRSRVIADTMIDGWRAHTLHMVCDCGLGWADRPLIFETAVFDHDGGLVQVFRSSTRTDAEVVHQQTVARLTKWRRDERAEMLNLDPPTADGF